ncbi:MAG TPA: hypothetical protein VFW45_07275 [Candidatus Polarisedimenticolia bacterium]|nr:hypothetical protein [Candidatus Polarisedimenticolia bacterium]
MAARKVQTHPAKRATTGMSDEAVFKKTGKTWEEWFAVLDRAGAKQMSHQEVANHLYTVEKIDGWWSQMVTVGYERERGRRVKHQSAAGFQVSATRTLPVTPDRLFKSWSDTRARNRWLKGAPLEITKANPGKNIRARWEGGESSLEIRFVPKGTEKCQVTVDHTRLPDAKAAAKMKKFWGGKLEELIEILAP